MNNYLSKIIFILSFLFLFNSNLISQSIGPANKVSKDLSQKLASNTRENETNFGREELNLNKSSNLKKESYKFYDRLKDNFWELIHTKETVDIKNLKDSIIVFKNFNYSNEPLRENKDKSMDIYLKESYLEPNSSPKPIIFFIHGGGWNAGDKGFDPERIKVILDSGYVFISCNYRLSPNPVELDNPNRIKFPMHLEDVVQSFSKLISIAPLLNADTSRVCVMGHSAGGNLALSLAIFNKYLEKKGLNNSIIDAVVNFDGVGLNIESFIEQVNGSYKEMFLNAFGDSLKDWREASPTLNASQASTNTQFLLICQNDAFRSQFSYQLADSLKKNDINAFVYPAYNYNHNEILTKFGDFSDSTSTAYTKTIFQFIKDALNDDEKSD